MTITARVQVSHPDIGLTPTVQELANPSLRVVSNAGTDPENDMYFFLVGNDREPFERALEGDHTVADANRLSAFEGKHLYRITYAPDAVLISPKATEVGGITLDSQSTADGWLLHFQFPGRDALYQVWEFCKDAGVSFDIVELREQVDDPVEADPYGLTEPQREALLVAHGRGYFEEPREASLEELADALGISPTAVGGRLRRGMEKLIGATLDESGPGPGHGGPGSFGP